MYYLRHPESEEATIKTNNKQFAEMLVGEGYILIPAWRKEVVAFLKDWAHLAIAVLAARLFTYYALVPDYTDGWHFTVTAVISAALYNWMREHFA